jgi:hypothetical protein
MAGQYRRSTSEAIMITANRSLKLVHANGPDVDVAVRIFAPESNGSDWSCQYEIDWPEGTRKGLAMGIDSVQALLFALEKVGVEIYTSDHHRSGKLMWHGPERGYGFPVPQNLRDLLVGDDAKFL